MKRSILYLFILSFLFQSCVAGLDEGVLCFDNNGSVKIELKELTCCSDSIINSAIDEGKYFKSNECNECVDVTLFFKHLDFIALNESNHEVKLKAHNNYYDFFLPIPKSSSKIQSIRTPPKIYFDWRNLDQLKSIVLII